MIRYTKGYIKVFTACYGILVMDGAVSEVGLPCNSDHNVEGDTGPRPAALDIARRQLTGKLDVNIDINADYWRVEVD